MKRLSLGMLILLATTLQANDQKPELAWVDAQIQAIKPPRKGVSPTTIKKLRDPFIYLGADGKLRKKYIKHTKRLTKKRVKREIPRKHYRLLLEAIINKSALINGRWYKEGSMVYDYKLKQVTPKTVILTRGSERIMLSTFTQNHTIKFINK